MSWCLKHMDRNSKIVKKKDQPGLLFHTCCQASKVKDFAKLKELVLFEAFKKCMW